MHTVTTGCAAECEIRDFRGIRDFSAPEAHMCCDVLQIPNFILYMVIAVLIWVSTLWYINVACGLLGVLS